MKLVVSCVTSLHGTLATTPPLISSSVTPSHTRPAGSERDDGKQHGWDCATLARSNHDRSPARDSAAFLCRSGKSACSGRRGPI